MLNPATNISAAAMTPFGLLLSVFTDPHTSDRYNIHAFDEIPTFAEAVLVLSLLIRSAYLGRTKYPLNDYFNIVALKSIDQVNSVETRRLWDDFKRLRNKWSLYAQDKSMSFNDEFHEHYFIPYFIQYAINVNSIDVNIQALGRLTRRTYEV